MSLASPSAPSLSSSPAAPEARPTGPISLPEEAREILADGFWRAANERQRQRKGLPPAPRSDCFPKPWFQHSFALDETAAALWGALWRAVALALEVLETPASAIGKAGMRHTLLVGHFARIASLYAQLERWQGQARALTLLEQALELLC
ncbi:MAG TPA: hypothetical protein VH590_15865 [Ktedonobacterales bacterium]|jgi:hypothetical protein